MNRSKQTVIAAIITAVFALVTIIRAGVALATQDQAAQEMGYGFIAVILIINTVVLVSAYGIWQDQKWGKILAITGLGILGLLALPGVIFAPTLIDTLSPAVDVIVAITVIILLLYRPKKSVAV